LFRIKLRAGIERERLCAPVLVIPQRKMALVEAFLVVAAMRAHPEREGRGKEMVGEGAPWGW
jgi:hypothetical protein